MIQKIQPQLATQNLQTLHTKKGKSNQALILTGPQDVQTPREVYEALEREGYRVNYHRIPITDGSSPREAIFDQFYEAIWQTSRPDPVIFNCQMGAGRTTMGMVIACLIRARKFGGFLTSRMNRTALPYMEDLMPHRDSNLLLLLMEAHNLCQTSFLKLSLLACSGSCNPLTAGAYIIEQSVIKYSEAPVLYRRHLLPSLAHPPK